jgi:hypothetical protein
VVAAPDTLNGRTLMVNLPKIRHAQEATPSTIDEKTAADFTRVVERTGILDPGHKLRQLMRSYCLG